jgi:hypothetical protein
VIRTSAAFAPPDAPSKAQKASFLMIEFIVWGRFLGFLVFVAANESGMDEWLAFLLTCGLIQILKFHAITFVTMSLDSDLSRTFV